MQQPPMTVIVQVAPPSAERQLLESSPAVPTTTNVPSSAIAAPVASPSPPSAERVQLSPPSAETHVAGDFGPYGTPSNPAARSTPSRSATLNIDPPSDAFPGDSRQVSPPSSES